MDNIKIRRCVIFLYLAVIVSFHLQVDTFAGAWTQKKGSGYYKVDFRYLSGNKVYNSDGIKIPIPTFNDMTVGAFGSYGITNEFTLFLGIAAFKSVSLDTTTTAAGFETDVSGLGDISFGGKYLIGRIGKTVLSAKIIFGLPTGKSEPDGGLWTGSGDYNQAIGIEAGTSFYPAPVYLTGGISFNNRTAGFSDEFKYRIEAGYKFFKNLTLILRFHGQVSLKNGNSNVKGGFGTYSNNQQFIAYNAELVYKVAKHWGVKGYYESGTNGRNIISAPVFNVGIFITN